MHVRARARVLVVTRLECEIEQLHASLPLVPLAGAPSHSHKADDTHRSRLSSIQTPSRR